MTQKHYKNITLMALVFAVGFSPLFAFAKSDNENKGKSKEKQEIRLNKSEKKEEKKERKEDKKENRKEVETKFKNVAKVSDDKDDNDDEDRNESKGKAYGHIIAPGYIKNWGSVDLSKYVYIPLSIWKKLIGTGTSTPSTDTTAPVISNIISTVSTTTATISWRTDERANGVAYLSTTTPVILDGNTSSTSHSYFSRNHEIILNNLSASTTYFVILSSKDKSGNLATSTQFSFTTKGGVIGDNQPPVISSLVSTVGTSTINVVWNTNESSTSKMYYSTVSPLITTASTTNFIVANTLVLIHNMTATGLATSTPYHIILESIDGSGNVSRSTEFTATTTSGL